MSISKNREKVNSGYYSFRNKISLNSLLFNNQTNNKHGEGNLDFILLVKIIPVDLYNSRRF